MAVLSWTVATSCQDETPTTPEPEGSEDVAAITMRPAARHIGILGSVVEIMAIKVGEDGSSLESSRRYPVRFTWASSAPDIATVDELGMVTAVAEGTTEITATSEGFTGTATVTVKDAARLAWSLPIDFIANAGIAVGQDGAAYVGTNFQFLALDPGGAILWTVATQGGPQSGPATGSDGTIYFGEGMGGENASLTAVGPNGAPQWTLSGLGSVQGSPALGKDGTIYIASRDSALYAVTPEGEVKWAHKVPARFTFSSPAIAEDGTIYAGAMNGRLYALNPDGTEKWSFRAGGDIWAAPSIAHDGTIYVTAFNGKVYAVNPDDGTKRWELEVARNEIYSSPSIGPDGTIYVGMRGVHAISPDGVLLWSSDVTDSVVSTPIIAGDGSIYFGTLGGGVYALNADGSLKWDYDTGSLVSGSPAIGIDGTIFAATFDSTAYAFVEVGSSNGGYDSAPWPTSRGDRANTGRAGGL